MREAYPERLSSREAASFAIGELGHCFSLLQRKDGVTPDNDRLVVRGHGRVEGLDMYSPSFGPEGNIGEESCLDSFVIKKKVETGAVTYAGLQGYVHNTKLSDRGALEIARGDLWQARFQISQPMSAEEHRKVVLDTWRVQTVSLGLAGFALGRQGGRLPSMTLNRLFDREKGTGIPKGAVEVTHSVYGRSTGLDRLSQDRLFKVLHQLSESVDSYIHNLRLDSAPQEAGTTF